MIRRKWHTFRALSPRERRLAARAYPRLLVTRARLRLMGYAHDVPEGGVAQLEGRHRPRGGVGVPDAGQDHVRAVGHLEPTMVAEAVDRAARYQPGGARCLARAVTVRSLLVDEGIAAVVRFGVRRGSDGQLEAHAWVEVAGEPVGEAGAAGLAAFTPLESAAGAPMRLAPPA